MRFLIVLIVAVCATGIAEAYDSSTRYLYEMCKNESTIGVCAGYVAAVAEFMETASTRNRAIQTLLNFRFACLSRLLATLRWLRYS